MIVDSILAVLEPYAAVVITEEYSGAVFAEGLVENIKTNLDEQVKSMKVRQLEFEDDAFGNILLVITV